MTTDAEQIAREALAAHDVGPDTMGTDLVVRVATTAAEVAADEVRAERGEKDARETRSEALKRAVEATRLGSGYPAAKSVIAFAGIFESYLNGEEAKK